MLKYIHMLFWTRKKMPYHYYYSGNFHHSTPSMCPLIHAISTSTYSPHSGHPSNYFPHASKPQFLLIPKSPHNRKHSGKCDIWPKKVPFLSHSSIKPYRNYFQLPVISTFPTFRTFHDTISKLTGYLHLFLLPPYFLTTSNHSNLKTVRSFRTPCMGPLY